MVYVLGVCKQAYYDEYTSDWKTKKSYGNRDLYKHLECKEYRFRKTYLMLNRVHRVRLLRMMKMSLSINADEIVACSLNGEFMNTMYTYKHRARDMS